MADDSENRPGSQTGWSVPADLPGCPDTGSADSGKPDRTADSVQTGYSGTVPAGSVQTGCSGTVTARYVKTGHSATMHAGSRMSHGSASYNCPESVRLWMPAPVAGSVPALDPSW